jgi:hypothetical protein
MAGAVSPTSLKPTLWFVGAHAPFADDQSALNIPMITWLVQTFLTIVVIVLPQQIFF